MRLSCMYTVCCLLGKNLVIIYRSAAAWCVCAACIQMHAVGVPLNYKLWRSLVGTGALVLLVCDWQYFFAKKQQEA